MVVLGVGPVGAGKSGGGSGGSDGSFWSANPFDGITDAVVDVATELSSFVVFQKRVDDLIRDLKGSAAGPAKVGQEQLGRPQFGGGDGAWAEAAGLFGAYGTVLTELEGLSKLLSDSMEGMGIAVLASHKGYRNVDEDIRDRMAEISAGISERYGSGAGAGAGQEPGRADRRTEDPAGDAGGSI
ncbi:hypothetical protein [Streptomyces flavofungini]|uniref:hypothetical protein n=1 Tax=Streptomyces flavofungini TaxID=68200 RepID=UPI00339D383D